MWIEVDIKGRDKKVPEPRFLHSQFIIQKNTKQCPHHLELKFQQNKNTIYSHIMIDMFSSVKTHGPYLWQQWKNHFFPQTMEWFSYLLNQNHWWRQHTFSEIKVIKPFSSKYIAWACARSFHFKHGNPSFAGHLEASWFNAYTSCVQVLNTCSFVMMSYCSVPFSATEKISGL